jgi:transcriptional regulator with XRE-family HTH domain
MQRYIFIPPQATLPAQLRYLREVLKVSVSQIAKDSGLTRVTVSAAEGNADARLSTVTTLFDTLGYALVPVPKSMAVEVASFVGNGGHIVSKPAGTEAPVNDSLAAFRNHTRIVEDRSEEQSGS